MMTIGHESREHPSPAVGRISLLRASLLGPGLLVAATGVGAGDLATASIAGSRLGLGILWAVLVGAFLKYVLNEGLARWQLVTGETLLEGASRRFGRLATTLFLLYLIFFSLVVGRALASACGVTAHALLPVFTDPGQGKIVFGALHSLVGIGLVLAGGYRLFERIMSLCIALMVVTVVVTAGLIGPGVLALLQQLAAPTTLSSADGSLTWTVALLGGIGGTVTLLCYGYWIREEGREGEQALRLCRYDLATGYLVTAVFGLAMVVIGSQVEVDGGGALLLVHLGDRLGETLGLFGRLLFLLGAWGAVACSLLGVWQSIPYLFADLWRLLFDPGTGEGKRVDVRGKPYRYFLLALGLSSIAGLFSSFIQVQKAYAIVGALFIPMLAATLLLLNGRRAWIGKVHRNRPLTSAVLLACLAMFLYFGWVRLS